MFPMYVVDSPRKNLLKDTRKILKSHAIEMETRLRECVFKYSEHTLDPALVIACASILEEISLGPGPYSKVLREINQVIDNAIFVDTKTTSADVKAADKPLRVTYFQLCTQLGKEFRNLEREKSELLQKLKAQDELLHRSAPTRPTDGTEGEDKDPSAAEYADEPARPPEISRQPSADELDADDGSAAAHRPMHGVRAAPSVLLKKTDFELKAKVIQLQQDLEHNMQLRKNAEKASTDLKGAFLRLKRDYVDVQDRLQAAEAQCQSLFLAMQGSPHGRAGGDDLDYEAAGAGAGEAEDGGAPRGDGLTPRPNWFGVPADVRVACNLAPGKERSAAAVRKLVIAFRKLHRQKEAGRCPPGPPVARGGVRAVRKGGGGGESGLARRSMPFLSARPPLPHGEGSHG